MDFGVIVDQIVATGQGNVGVECGCSARHPGL